MASLVDRGEVELAGTVVDDPRPGGSTQQVVLEEVAEVGAVADKARELFGTLARELAFDPRQAMKG